jgi:hypothetical protein
MAPRYRRRNRRTMAGPGRAWLLSVDGLLSPVGVPPPHPRRTALRRLHPGPEIGRRGAHQPSSITPSDTSGVIGHASVFRSGGPCSRFRSPASTRGSSGRASRSTDAPRASGQRELDRQIDFDGPIRPSCRFRPAGGGAASTDGALPGHAGADARLAAAEENGRLPHRSPALHERETDHEGRPNRDPPDRQAARRPVHPATAARL